EDVGGVRDHLSRSERRQHPVLVGGRNDRGRAQRGHRRELDPLEVCSCGEEVPADRDPLTRVAGRRAHEAVATILREHLVRRAVAGTPAHHLQQQRLQLGPRKALGQLLEALVTDGVKHPGSRHGADASGDAPWVRDNSDVPTLEAPETKTRRLLAWLGAGLLAGGMPVHEVEEDVREVAETLGHPRTQVACSPNAISFSLASGEPATLERVEGGLRLDQLAEVSVLQAGLRTRSIGVDDALARMATLRRQPHRYPKGGLLAGGVLSGAGIALVLAPSWPSVFFAAAIAPATVALMLLSPRSSLV